MTTGMVGNSGRAMSSVAPNSPMLTVNANSAATSSARPMIGRSTSRQTADGDAPRMRGRLAPVGVDPAHDRQQRAHDERERHERVRDRHERGDARRSSGGRPSVSM